MRLLAAALGALCAFVSLASVAQAAEEGYYAHPALHGDQIVFASEGDLWTVTVPPAGTAGPLVAHRLTSSPGDESWPCFSPDGRSIAFSGQYDGNVDVFVMSSDGGTPRRLTYHPAAEVALGWTPDGTQVLFRSAARQPLGRAELWRVPAAGGAPARYPFGECSMAAIHPDGRRIAFTRWSNENWTWKRYRGGTAPDVWVGDLAAGTFRRLTETDSNEMFPAWLGDRVLFLSDRTGTANLWSDAAAGGDLRAHTSFASKPGDPTAVEGYDVRWPSLDAAPGGTRVVFCQAGGLALLDTKDGGVRRLDVRLASDRSASRDRFADPTETTTEYGLSRDGKTILLGSRGEVLAVPVEEGLAPLQLTRSSEAREWGVAPLGKDRLVMISDASGEQEIAVAPADGSAAPKSVASDEKEWLFPPVASPDGASVAYGDKSLHLTVLDVKTKQKRIVDSSEAGEIRDYRFSPDGRWLAYVVPLVNGCGAIRLLEVATGKVVPVSGPVHDDFEPRWDPAGKYLYFLTHRHLDPTLGDLDFEHVFLGTTAVYAIPLARTTPPPLPDVARAAGFDLEAWAEAPDDDEDDSKDAKGKGEAGGKKSDEKGGATKDAGTGPGRGGGTGDASADEKGSGKGGGKGGGKDGAKGGGKSGANGGDDGKASAAEPVVIDLEGLSDRAVALPIDPGDLRRLEATWGGVLWLTDPRQGLLAGDDDDTKGAFGEGDATLTRHDLSKEGDDAEQVLAKDIAGYALSADAKTVVYASGGALRVTEAGGDGKDPKKVAVASLKIRVATRSEWKQILGEAWRLQRDFYWAPTLCGCDWAAMRAKYEALLPRVGTRAELNDLIGQMIGELGTSHTYVWGGPAFDPPAAVSVGLLGADLERDGAAVRIRHVVAGPSWAEDLASPLAAAHLGVKEGDVLLSIDGTDLASGRDPYDLLADKAGKRVKLEVASDAQGKDRRAITVKALSSESTLRYAEWVEANRRYVDERSKGALGYLHVPDMGGAGLVAFSRLFYPQVTKKGLVVDIRGNRGGFVSQMIIRRLDRQVWAFMQPRHGVAARYPEKALYGPMAVLIDQHAGSDGDIFPASFRLRGLGPLIGRRTWGGVVGIRADKPFVDMGMSTQPEFAWWSPKDGWSVENRGVSPDVDVDVSPADRAAGKDPQLDTAVDWLLDKLAKEPRELPKHPDFPIR